MKADERNGRNQSRQVAVEQIGDERRRGLARRCREASFSSGKHTRPSRVPDEAEKRETLGRDQA